MNALARRENAEIPGEWGSGMRRMQELGTSAGPKNILSSGIRAGLLQTAAAPVSSMGETRDIFGKLSSSEPDILARVAEW